MSERPEKPPLVIPWAAVTACLAGLTGAGLMVAGVNVLLGPGWALLAAAAPCIVLSFVILRGL